MGSQSNELRRVARSIVAEGKGILAADESTGTIAKRFASVGIECTALTRNAYRDLLFTAPGIEEFIGGVILYDETIRQTTVADGIPFPKYLAGRGILPGIKVDTGTKPLALHPGELITEGLDGLRGRLQEYRSLGARFAKWRAVITIGPGLPSDACISTNTHALALYAALCQEEGIVPIVEPEVLMDGDHTIERCLEVTEQVLARAFHHLGEQGVELEGIILKPNMIIPGAKCPKLATVEEVAEATVRCLARTVPVSVPGICFLSGGQGEVEATQHLDAMNRLPSPRLWRLSFSYGRALQAAALKKWRGDPTRVIAAQRAFVHRSRCNGFAARGAYDQSIEMSSAD